jgi:hypothetical protein
VLRNIVLAFEKTGEREKEEEVKQLLAVLTDEHDPYASQ